MHIKTERLRSAFRQAPLTLLVTLINALLTTIVLATVVDYRRLAMFGPA